MIRIRTTTTTTSILVWNTGILLVVVIGLVLTTTTCAFVLTSTRPPLWHPQQSLPWTWTPSEEDASTFGSVASNQARSRRVRARTATTATTTTTTVLHAESWFMTTTESLTVVSSSKNDDMSMVEFLDTTPIVVVGIALIIGIAAQSFINQMLDGEDGLAAFLTDGTGYNKSGFRLKNSTTTTRTTNPIFTTSSRQVEENKDPLPWLKLPQLDFVEVAGQTTMNQQQLQDEAMILSKLESLRKEMTMFLDQGKIQEATIVRLELEAFMEETGIEYR